ncbi:MAG: hypothetical protein ACT6FF_02510 [Methanosarcinaceae archaeon]
MKTGHYFAIALILLIHTSSLSAQEIPKLIFYQGNLTNNNGNPINGNQPMKFSIWSAQTGGNELWKETHSAVAVNQGLFSAMLGSQNPITSNVFSAKTRYLEIVIGGETLSPRQQIASVAYAHTAAGVSGAENVFPSDGNVGIGTTNPLSKLYVREKGVNKLQFPVHLSNPENTDGGGTATGILFETESNGFGKGGLVYERNRAWGKGAFHFLQNSLNDESFPTLNDAVVTINNDGNVGVGISAPSDKLEVAGTIHSTSGGFKFPDGTLQSTAATGGSGGDNLGNHIATQNIKLNNHFISNDGQNEGISIDNSGTVTIRNSLATGNPSTAYGSGDIIATDDIIADDDVLVGGTVKSYSGIEGYISSSSAAVYAKNTGSGRAIHGHANTGYAVLDGFNSGSGCGVYGGSSAGYEGKLGGSTYGAFGTHSNGNYGKLGTINEGVYAKAANSSKKAGYFGGNVHVNGVLSKASGSFMIDHPLDPANMYLSHSFVESPDMMNIYNGNITLDAKGEALVEMPDWFDALNQDFRYQLTCIGGFSQVYIAEKINNNHFKIAGGSSGMEVSWQVTGIRKDAWAEAHRIQVEIEKTGEDRGKYQNPKEHGVSETLGIDYEEIKRMEKEIKRMEEENKRIEEESQRLEEQHRLFEETQKNAEAGRN